MWITGKTTKDQGERAAQSLPFLCLLLPPPLLVLPQAHEPLKFCHIPHPTHDYHSHSLVKDTPHLEFRDMEDHNDVGEEGVVNVFRTDM
jgi:hypothetical protein